MANEKDHTIQFRNQDDFSNIMQLWVDVDNPKSTPQTADAPFLILPSVFKIAPKQGQAVRLIYTGRELPQDRESIFYLNFLQIPPTEQSDKNKMLVMLRNRVKIFYRPEKLSDDVSQLPDRLNFALKKKDNELLLEVHNTSPYFASFANAALINEQQQIKLPVTMIPPFSRVIWSVNETLPYSNNPAQIKFTLINDLGALITSQHQID